jgi:hypothetical protein
VGHALAQVRIARTSGLPEDVCINTFHFQTPQPVAVSAAEALSIVTGLEDFYQGLSGTAATTLMAWFSGVVATGPAHEIRVYDMNQPMPRIPVATATLSLTPGSTFLPSEVACCLSYRTNPVVGIPRARTRGRIYFGPLASTTSDATNTAGDVRPKALFTQTLRDAGARLKAPLPGTGIEWAVYSKTGLALRPVDVVSVDNAYDTQRRRGAASTSRITG